MNRRLRKKKRVGQFQEYGFRIRFQFSSDLPISERNDLLNSFLREAIEANSLQFGGGGHLSTWDGFATLDRRRGSATNDQRHAVTDWLERDPLVSSHRVFPLVDAWYGSFGNGT